MSHVSCPRFTRWMTVAAALALAACLPPPCHAQPATPAPTTEELQNLPIQQLQQDIMLFRILWGMQLTAKQGEDILGVFTPVADASAKLRQNTESAEGRAALLALRMAVAAGKPITPQMMARLDAARRGATGAAGPPAPGQQAQNPEQALSRMAQDAAHDALGLLTPDQALYLAAPQAGDMALNICQQIPQVREINPGMWQPWKQQIVTTMSANHKENPDLAGQLGLILDEAWAMAPEVYAAQRGQIAAKLAKVLAPKMSDPERTERAAGFLSEQLIGSPRFIVCLREYLQNVTAAAQPAPAP